MYYLNTSENEGLGICWAWNGEPVNESQGDGVCALCQVIGCDSPVLDKEYKDNVWYMQLGTESRYRDVVGRLKRQKHNNL